MYLNTFHLERPLPHKTTRFSSATSRVDRIFSAPPLSASYVISLLFHLFREADRTSSDAYIVPHELDFQLLRLLSTPLQLPSLKRLLSNHVFEHHY